MKKKWMMLLLAAGLMTGCSNSNPSDAAELIDTEEISSETEKVSFDTEEISSDTEEISSETEEVSSEAEEILSETDNKSGINETEAANIPEAYKGIIHQAYELIIADDEEVFAEDGTIGILEAHIGRDTEETLSHVGYMLYDVDGNGVEELIIADMGEGSWDSRILAMYSLSDDKPVLVIDGWARNRFYILNDGMFYYEGSGGAAYTTFATYHMAEDGISLAPVDYYFSDYREDSGQEWGWFHNTTGEREVEKSEIMELEDENVPWEMMKEFEAQIKHLDVTRFIDYEAAGGN